jgi:hypothetical protein
MCSLLLDERPGLAACSVISLHLDSKRQCKSSSGVIDKCRVFRSTPMADTPRRRRVTARAAQQYLFSLMELPSVPSGTSSPNVSDLTAGGALCKRPTEVTMRSTKIAVLGLLATTIACGREEVQLAPAPSATPVAGPGRGAEATVAGVRTEARAEAWKWDPKDLGTKVTPILVELENNGSRPMLVRYNRFHLTSDAGQQFAAMPPYDIRGTIQETYTIRNPYYPYSGFAIAPYLVRWYPRFRAYNGAFAFDPSYYDPYMTRFRQVRLPTAEMVQRALPEGVLEPGGRVTGFVYFERLPKGVGPVRFTADLVDAQTIASLGTISIPFISGE